MPLPSPNPAVEPELPPAVPPYRADLEQALAIIGQKEHFIVQLRAEMVRRAHEANAIHDELVKAKAQLRLAAERSTTSESPAGED